MKSQINKKYVIDTGILIDYPHIIVNDGSHSMDEATVDLSQAEIFIPAVVINQLSKFKNEDSNRGNSAKYVLNRLERLGANRMISMQASYELKDYIPNGQQKIHIVTLPSDFGNNLIYQPDKEDVDGQIILAAIYVYKTISPSHGINNVFVTTTASSHNCILKALGVELLTNKRELAILAREQGVDARGFKYEQRTYTGYRNLKVPKDLYYNFIQKRAVSIDEWKKFMPDEPDFEANEFVIMEPDQKENDSELEFDQIEYRHIGRYDFKSKHILALEYLKSSSLRPKSNGQAMYMEALLHPEIDAVIAYGPAGTGKTFLASILGYESCLLGGYIDVTVVPAHVENDGVGYLPGDLNEKLDPNVQPIKNALRNYFIENDKDIRKQMDNFAKFGANNKAKPERNSNQQCQKSIKNRLDNLVELTWSDWFNNIPIAYARGRDFAHEFVIYDEFQDQDNNGLVHAKKMLTGLPTTAQIELKSDEIVRHLVVRQVVERQKQQINRHLRV